MRTKKELKQLAIDIVEGKVFGSWQISNPDLLPLVFMTLFFMEEKQIKDLEKEGVVHFYEYLDKANQMSVNGMPTFFSSRTITKDEQGPLQSMIKKLQEQKKKFLKG